MSFIRNAIKALMMKNKEYLDKMIEIFEYGLEGKKVHANKIFDLNTIGIYKFSIEYSDMSTASQKFEGFRPLIPLANFKKK